MLVIAYAALNVIVGNYPWMIEGALKIIFYIIYGVLILAVGYILFFLWWYYLAIFLAGLSNSKYKYRFSKWPPFVEAYDSELERLQELYKDEEYEIVEHKN